MKQETKVHIGNPDNATLDVLKRHALFKKACETLTKR